MSPDVASSGDGGAVASGRVLELVIRVMHTRKPPRPIGSISLDDNLRDVGLTSIDMVDLMLAIEAQFDLKIPDSDMTLRNFRSVSSIEALISVLMRRK